MLHEFRQQLDLAKLRRVNEFLLRPLIEGTAGFAKTVALIDSTDLPAATNAYKKTTGVNIAPTGPKPGRAAAKKARAVISSATKNIPCDSGCASIRPVFCWPR
jgi:hypothetical protein